VQQEAMARQEALAPADGRRQPEERRRDNLPDERPKRGVMRGDGKIIG